MLSFSLFLASHIPIGPVLTDGSSSPDIARRSTAPILFNESNTELAYSVPNRSQSIRPQLDPCDLQGLSQHETYHHHHHHQQQKQQPEIQIDYLDNYDDVEGEETSAQLREQYARAHGLRRHTIGRPDLLIHGGPIPELASKVRFAHQSASIEPTLLANRLTSLQQRKDQESSRTPTRTVAKTEDNDEEEEEDDDDLDEACSLAMRNRYQQKKPHSISSNGLSGQSPVMNVIADDNDHQQRDNQWLSPPVSSYFSR